MATVDLSAYTPTFRDVAGELAIAKVFAAAAAAATASSKTVSFILGPTRREMQRTQRDAFLLCVDRATTRVYPPLDPLRYLSETSPAFSAEATSKITVSFEVQPLSDSSSDSFLYCASAATCREGGKEGGAAGDHGHKGCLYMVEGELIRSTTAPMMAATMGGQSAAALAEQDGDDAPNVVEDEDFFWQVQRAGKKHKASVQALLPAMCADGEAKLRKLQWRLSCWLADRFVNEASWAKLPSSFHLSSTLAPGGRQHARPGRPSADEQPRFKNVVEAALAMSQSTSVSEKTSTRDGARATSDRRVVHADVRGMQFEGLVVGYTPLYAYIAVPYTISATAATSSSLPSASSGQRPHTNCRTKVQWSLVSRVPLPSWLAYKVKEEGHAQRRRRRQGAKSSQGDEGTWYNMAEAILHDDASTFVELAEDERVTVTMMAHRVFCKVLDASSSSSSMPLISPARLSMWFDDAYMTAYSKPSTSRTVTAVKKFRTEAVEEEIAGLDEEREPVVVPDSLNTFADVAGLLRESCTRYLRAHARIMSYRSSGFAVAAGKSDVCQSTAAEDDATASASCADEEDMVRNEEVDFAAATAQKTLFLSSRARLVGAAESLFMALTDSTSVHFKKARGAGASALNGSVPRVSTCSDVAGLFEGCTVEFKYSLGGSTMDAERLRNTIAAMASARGGVIVVGVTDGGVVVGHAPGQVTGPLRVSGFCPAMVKDAVVAREIRVLAHTAAAAAAATANGKQGDSSSGAPVAKMPANWWKQAAPGSTPQTSAEMKKSTFSGEMQVTSATAAKVITVITVNRGQSPFCTSSRRAMPYCRGCASTVKMSMRVLADRLLHHLVSGV